ncbi:hypothetical protein Q8W71_12220 [Methylobacterium sp. NEAU 140]|uniref:hypothetical protein n=1 Tax=Methylobacterium sp. NEAU 140 TaxID=3064945 RepID=UPI002733478B|nr:hypothetical protein [Methylobacterium sp. NEAU 140]MDP4023395.1 hypothetical protein [Methylobacterium sp. NEAU 140]
MRRADPQRLQDAISGVIKDSPIGRKFRGLTLAADQGDDDDSLIRVVVRVSEMEDVSDDDIDALTSSIEHAVNRHDDRFPSVRYSEN